MTAFADLPVAAQFALMIAAGLGIAVLLSWIASRTIESDVRSRAGGSVATVLGVVAALYAVLVAIVIVTEWQSFDDVSTRVSGEAAALAATYYSASTLGEPARTDIQQHVLEYGARSCATNSP